jgi:hypothetical protein
VAAAQLLVDDADEDDEHGGHDGRGRESSAQQLVTPVAGSGAVVRQLEDPIGA